MKLSLLLQNASYSSNLKVKTNLFTDERIYDGLVGNAFSSFNTNAYEVVTFYAIDDTITVLVQPMGDYDE